MSKFVIHSAIFSVDRSVRREAQASRMIVETSAHRTARRMSGGNVFHRKKQQKICCVSCIVATLRAYRVSIAHSRTRIA
jgi:hypothetical protein